ncbi:MAG: molybdopterin molybdotransferase MoeA [Rhodobacteraceae bacterium]|nr:molybdopterin molybdotransferase MoeA [Paracoccaceae bacterium]
MISPAQALARIFDLTPPQQTSETVALAAAGGRVLAEDIVAARAQPPFAASAMDGYAVRSEDATGGNWLRIIGGSIAGRGCDQPVRRNEAVRILTGAPVPEGADRIVIQEDVFVDGDRIRIAENADRKNYVRAAGGDYPAGQKISANQPLNPALISMAAAMNVSQVVVWKRPVVSIIPTGDELREPGCELKAHEITASSGYGLAAMLDKAGAESRLLPVAADNRDSLVRSFKMAAHSDMIVSLGGASVGDRDLVAGVAAELGMDLAFHNVAVRPGKPLLAGRLFDDPFVGLPGNPVSAMVCGRIFLVPAIHAMLHRGWKPPERFRSPLAAPVSGNGIRQHYMRAELLNRDGQPMLRVFKRQDSSLISVYCDADALAVRPPQDPARAEGEYLEYIPLNHY